MRPRHCGVILSLQAPAPAADADGRGGPGPENLIQVGYSQDKPHVLTAHHGCHALGPVRPGGTLVHDCDATHGDSGSPILVLTAGGPRLFAMHVATGKGSAGAVGIAVPAASIDPGR